MNQERLTAISCICHLIKSLVNPSMTYNDDLLRQTNWRHVKALASRQGVSSIISDALPYLPEEYRPSSDFLIDWMSSIIGQERRYAIQESTIAELSSFYQSHGVRMLLLKGWGLSLNYPYPNHRPCGDVDIWLYGDQQKADNIIEKEKGIHPIKSSHHTIFYFKDVEVENHITFIETDCHKDDGSERVILEYAAEDPIKVESANGVELLLPSPNLNAYFLLKHTALHFATEGVILRHLLDWAFFVRKYHSKIDWNALYENAKDRNMHVFLNCINAICINRLGFDSSMFPVYESYPDIEDRIFNDIFFPEFHELAPGIRKNFIKYCYVKSKRHIANRWKYQITYKGNYWALLLRFAWNRIKSPYSFQDINNR